MSELTSIWMSVTGNEHPALTWAITDLDYRLSRDPANEGESRPGDYRITFSRPLAILFRFDEPSATAHIGHVWRFE